MQPSSLVSLLPQSSLFQIFLHNSLISQELRPPNLLLHRPFGSSAFSWDKLSWWADKTLSVTLPLIS